MRISQFRILDFRVVLVAMQMAAIGILGGCSNSAPPLEPQPLQPLTIADWKNLTGNEKFAEETMERLKLGDPKLNTTKGWNKFLATEMKAELAKSKAQQAPSNQ
ncbi:hypothetical protein SH668x_002214 [Planctomicrobium sp. SH668]|uniref:hypothetical protein n=1 Tax=Planctomicrobium sp. SH668 TaxID=3448126 RepID=UPI003F5C8444